jgi:hypothetical protein
MRFPGADVLVPAFLGTACHRRPEREGAVTS